MSKGSDGFQWKETFKDRRDALVYAKKHEEKGRDIAIVKLNVGDNKALWQVYVK